MRLTHDDDTHRVNSKFLGPEGVTFPWEARYIAYGVGFGLFVLCILIERRLGIKPGVWFVVYPLLITVALTRWIGKYLNTDVSVRNLIVMVRDELTAPRPDDTVDDTDMTPNIRKARL